LSAPVRFLALVVFGWAGVRAATLGIIPGAEVFRVDASQAHPAPGLIATEFPPLDPPPPAAEEVYPAAYPVEAGFAPVRAPEVWQAAAVSAPVSYSGPTHFAGVLPTPTPAFYSSIPPLDEWPLSRIASSSMPQRRSSVVAPAQSIPAIVPQQRLDRVQLTSWAMLRGTNGLTGGPSSIAAGGMLGGNQAGARLTYNINRHLAASLRTSSEVGRRGGEVAAGVRLQPVAGIPVWITAERRQRLGKLSGGRNAFALFLEGGVYDRPLPWRFRLDAYLQGGVVGLHRRDRFVDGALTMTRPVYKNLFAGLGLWGGAQPGLYRVDAGPRLSLKVRDNVKVHLDYRQRLAGNAQPGSGPVVTLAGDF